MRKVYLTIFLIVTAAMVASCGGGEQAATETAKVKSVNVETQTVQPKTFERYLRLVGTVESENDVQISAEVTGRVERYYVEKGDRVAAGAPILKIDDSKLRRQQAQLQAQTEQARERYERLKQVFEEDSIGSKMDVINARTTYEERKAALESVEVDLRNTTVRAPFTAILDEKMVEVGEMASPGMPLVRLIGTGNLKVVTGVPSRFSNAISTGDRAEIWFDFQQPDTLRLPITYVGHSINRDARTFTVEINLPASTRNYKVDMHANVRIRTFRQDSAVVVGEEFVYQKDRGMVLYTVARDDSGNTIADEHVVTPGPSYQNNLVIENGLRFGEELITVGSSFLQDSTRINVVEEREGEIAQQNQ